MKCDDLEAGLCFTPGKVLWYLNDRMCECHLIARPQESPYCLTADPKCPAAQNETYMTLPKSFFRRKNNLPHKVLRSQISNAKRSPHTLVTKIPCFPPSLFHRQVKLLFQHFLLTNRPRYLNRSCLIIWWPDKTCWRYHGNLGWINTAYLGRVKQISGTHYLTFIVFRIN